MRNKVAELAAASFGARDAREFVASSPSVRRAACTASRPTGATTRLPQTHSAPCSARNSCLACATHLQLQLQLQLQPPPLPPPQPPQPPQPPPPPPPTTTTTTTTTTKTTTTPKTTTTTTTTSSLQGHKELLPINATDELTKTRLTKRAARARLK